MKTLLCSRAPYGRLRRRPPEKFPTSCPPACPTCACLRTATLTIVGADGLDALSEARLADHAGISVERQREHYPNARACLHATYDEVAAAIYEDLAVALRSQPNWYDALRASGIALTRRLSDRPAEARLCFSEIFQGDFELLRRHAASRRRLVNLFVRELGHRREDSESFAVQLELLIGASFQTIASAVGERRVDQLEALMPELETRAHVFEPA